MEEEFRNIKRNSGGSIQPGMLHMKWIICPNCHQYYSNDLTVAMAAGYRKQIEDLNEELRIPQLHQWLRCEAHVSLVDNLKEADNFQGIHLHEIGQLSNVILKELIPKIKNHDSVVPRQRQLELDAHVHEGGLSYYAEMKEDYEAAIKSKKRGLKILELLNSGAIELSYEADYEGEKVFRYDTQSIIVIVIEKQYRRQIMLT